MDDSSQAGVASSVGSTAWGFEVSLAVCERCDWKFLLPAGPVPAACPHCFAADLTVFPADKQIQIPYPPEMSAPFAISPATLQKGIQDFTQGIPFAPQDLNAGTLGNRMKRVYLPVWLVDVEAQATWKAEAGFDYQVVSHQDQYADGGQGWTMRQVQERRTRWELRLGSLHRTYANIPAPALEEHRQIYSALGAYDSSQAQPYQANALEQAFVRLPDRKPEDAWSDASLGVRNQAAEECRQAIGADHLRQFSWQPEFMRQNWTLLLLPAYTTYYLDDERKPQPVLIHGQTGRVSGKRRASQARAQQTALKLLVAAGVVFLFGLLFSVAAFFFPPALAVGVLGLAIALCLALSAVVPYGIAWWFNRSHPA